MRMEVDTTASDDNNGDAISTHAALTPEASPTVNALALVSAITFGACRSLA